MQQPAEPVQKLPIVYSPHYNIGFLGLEKLHPFDTRKFEKIHRYLRGRFAPEDNRFHTPGPVSQDDLLTIHTPEYLQSLRKSIQIARIAEVPPLALLPNILLRRTILRAMQYGTSGTILGAQLALEEGWAINLAGGYHHAKADSGGGFCFYADVPIAMGRLRAERPGLPILIVDLDAHQGNGITSILLDDPQTYTFDVYNKHIYPWDRPALEGVDFEFPVRSGIGDSDYLGLLERELPRAVKRAKPALIIYNAGTDVFEEDPLGQMGITAEGIIERDAFVFRQAHNRRIPILMVLSGGYTRRSATIIGRSIEHILLKVIQVPPRGR